MFLVNLNSLFDFFELSTVVCFLFVENFFVSTSGSEWLSSYEHWTTNLKYDGTNISYGSFSLPDQHLVS